jgi:hypothetical protein
LVKYRCYNLYLGAAFDGTRLNKLYAEDLDHANILAVLDPLFAAYARERPQGERFASAISAYARVSWHRRATAAIPMPKWGAAGCDLGRNTRHASDCLNFRRLTLRYASVIFLIRRMFM